MTASVTFPYISRSPALGVWSKMPLLPFRIDYQGAQIDVLGLVDSGSAINVIPFGLGLQLGADWDQQLPLPPLTGNLARAQARALFVTATIATFPPIRLIFAWSQDPAAPIVLGQMDFFEEFDVCLFRSHSSFEVKPKASTP